MFVNVFHSSSVNQTLQKRWCNRKTKSKMFTNLNGLMCDQNSLKTNMLQTSNSKDLYMTKII